MTNDWFVEKVNNDQRWSHLTAEDFGLFLTL